GSEFGLHGEFLDVDAPHRMRHTETGCRGGPPGGWALRRQPPATTDEGQGDPAEVFPHPTACCARARAARWLVGVRSGSRVGAGSAPCPERAMATVEQTMMKVQRILTGPMGLKVMLEGDRFR